MSAMNPDELRKRVADLGNWFHNVDLAPGVSTNPARPDFPENRWKAMEPHIPSDLTGKTVLDLACNSGYFAVRMKQRGAARVVGVEASQRLYEQARLVREVFNADIDLYNANVYSYLWNTTEQFDYIFYLGLFYHLRAPLLVLDKVALMVRERLFFQSERFPFDLLPDTPFPVDATLDTMKQPGYPKAYFIERTFHNDPSNWWLPDQACIEACLRSSGLTRFFRTEQEIYVCAPPPNRDAVPRYDVLTP